MAYHYRDSGLDNVFLESGVTVHQTPYGEGVSIEDTKGLHRAIGQWLVGLSKPLNGAELRFLRLEMDLTQQDLAQALGTTEQTLRLWEKQRAKVMSGPADRLLRLLYAEAVGRSGSVREIVDRLARPDVRSGIEARLRETARGWEVDGMRAA